MSPISFITPPFPSFLPLRLRLRHRRTAAVTETVTISGRRLSMAAWLQQVLSQRVNSSGIASFTDVIAGDPQLALPHLSVTDASHVDWAHLSRLGFSGVVFDKDNTLTAPYSLSLWPALSTSFRLCSDAFSGHIAIFSNSAGLKQYDPDGVEAKAVEEAISGVHVIRHGK